MAKRINRLNALQVKRINDTGWFPDGNGLYLQVSATNTKSWVYRYEHNKKERRHGLGSYPAITLEAARQSAETCRTLRAKGIDPIDFKNQKKAEKLLKASKGITFKECATAYIQSHKAGWKNSKHETQWTNTLKTYAEPHIGNLSVQSIDVGHVMQVLEPIWFTKTETASRVRQRIENILDWAKARNYRTGENPALWRGHLDKLLPKRTKVQKVQHFHAMPYSNLPDYFRKLRKVETTAAKALAFTILTACRTNEARSATWNEIDLDKAVWIIPANRMKADREHRVPLSKEALKILRDLKELKSNDYVFAGIKKDKPLSEAALLNLLKETHPNLTVHGFRSTFRDWCAEMTNYAGAVAEAALAHTVKDKTEAAYQRGDMLIKRAKLMTAWSSYCFKGKVSTHAVAINTKLKSL